MTNSKLIIILMIFSLVFSVSIAQAAINISGNMNVDKVKTTLVSFVDRQITAINNFETTKVANANIDESDKVLIGSMLDNMTIALENEKTAIQNATTIEEIRQLRQEIVQQMIANKVQIRAAVNELRKALNDEAMTKLNETLVAVNAKIDELQTKCPTQASQIDSAQTKLNKIAKDLADLNKMVLNEQNQMLISAKVAQISSETTLLVEDVSEIMTACTSA